MTLVISVARGFILCACFLGIPVSWDAFGQDVPGSLETDGSSPSSNVPGRVRGEGTAPSVAPSALPILPKSIALGGSSDSVDWTGLVRASGRFLAIEQGFRVLTEP